MSTDRQADGKREYHDTRGTFVCQAPFALVGRSLKVA